MRFRGAMALGLAALMASGCYSSRFLRGVEVAGVHGPHDDALTVPVTGGPPARLDPSSMIRFRRRDGSVSRWFAARHMLISDDGVLVSFDRVPITALRRAWVSGMQPEDASLLESVKPAEAELRRIGAQLELVPPPEGLDPWLRAFVAARPGLGAPAPAEEWQLSTRGLLVAVPGAGLGSAVERGVPRVDGLLWEDVSWVEVRNFDGVATFFTVVSAPVWLAAGVLIGRVGGGAIVSALFDEGLAAPVADNPSSRAPGGEVVLDEVIHQGNVLSTGVQRAPDVSSARDLFTPAAVRRSIWRPLLWLGGGLQFADGRSANLTVGVAARLSNVIELGGGITTWWPDFDGPGELRPGAPLMPGPPRWVPYFAGFGRVGADFGVDAARRVSLPLLIELATAGEPFMQVRLRFGLRIRVTASTFIALHPFNPHYTEQRLPDLESWTFPSSLEIGTTF
jgi:hypothetical protein